MSPLPLLLALAVSADPAATPAEPAAQAAVAPAAAEAPVETPVEAPGFIVAPPDAPAAEPATPAAPYVLDAFLPAKQPVAGAALRLGGSSAGFEAAIDPTVRWHGVVAGVSVGSAGSSGDGVQTLGLVVGVGHALGLYRGEALFGWGLASDRRPAGDATETRNGHYRGLQVGVDRALAGGDGWRATAGAGFWWRETFGLRGDPASHSEVGAGLRLGVEAGL